MSSKAVELVAALSELDSEQPFARADALQEALSELTKHPAPEGALRRLWAFGGLQAQIADHRLRESLVGAIELALGFFPRVKGVLFCLEGIIPFRCCDLTLPPRLLRVLFRNLSLPICLIGCYCCFHSVHLGKRLLVFGQPSSVVRFALRVERLRRLRVRDCPLVLGIPGNCSRRDREGPGDERPNQRPPRDTLRLLCLPLSAP